MAIDAAKLITNQMNKAGKPLNKKSKSLTIQKKYLKPEEMDWGTLLMMMGMMMFMNEQDNKNKGEGEKDNKDHLASIFSAFNSAGTRDKGPALTTAADVAKNFSLAGGGTSSPLTTSAPSAATSSAPAPLPLESPYPTGPLDPKVIMELMSALGMSGAPMGGSVAKTTPQSFVPKSVMGMKITPDFGLPAPTSASPTMSAGSTNWRNNPLVNKDVMNVLSYLLSVLGGVRR